MSRLRKIQGNRFLRETRGISSVEFALVAGVFFLFVFGIIDFSRALWEWNMAAKATQFGARYAAISDPAAVEIATFSGLSLSPPIGNGAPIPEDRFNGGNPVVCTAAGCQPDGWTLDVVAFNAIVTKMQAYYDRIRADDVIVEYRHIGLGFSGNPFGSDIRPLVTVKLVPREFEFVTPGLIGIVSITMPDFATSLTAEDMSG